MLLYEIPILPKTVDDAVELLIEGMSLKDRVRIANMSVDDLVVLYKNLSVYMKNVFRLEYENKALLKSCQQISQKPIETPDEVAAVIMGVLFKRLNDTNKLRMVK